MTKTKYIDLLNYNPHQGQIAFHYAANNLYRFCLLLSGIRGGKTVAGARQAGDEALAATAKGVYGIIAPTYNMLDRTTWMEFREANQDIIKHEIESKKIIILKNDRQVHGFSAENPDRLRNATFVGFWGDEAREWKNFRKIWQVLIGRVLSTNGKGIITSSPNSFDEMHEIFVAEKRKGYGIVSFPTYQNTYLDAAAIDDLSASYDAKFAEQEIAGKFVIFQGAVYYTFNRKENAGDLAFKVCQYNKNMAIDLCCDFNVDPMAWTLAHTFLRPDGLKEVRVFDEIFVQNSNTEECCKVFQQRYPSHRLGINLYGDATGKARHSSSNVTNWKIIKDLLGSYGITTRVPLANPAERDRINAMNAMICDSKGRRKVLVNPIKCPKLVRDLEQVSFKPGTTMIDKTRDISLTHPSDGFGYMIEREFSLNKARAEILKY